VLEAEMRLLEDKIKKGEGILVPLGKIHTEKDVINIGGVEYRVYRGGKEFKLKLREYRVTPDGNYPARGLSLNADPNALKTWGANKLISIPDGLRIIHTPSSKLPYHLDIIPKDLTISQEEFQILLNKSKFNL
jgi:hypothetical protein